MKKYILFLIITIAISCDNESSDEAEYDQRLEHSEETNPVDILVLERTSFYRELVSNGKLKSIRRSELQFPVGEELIELNVRNGKRVDSGQVIARLRTDRIEEELNQAKVQLQSARLELQDILIGQGYELKDSLNIPGDIHEVAKIRSGYASAQASLRSSHLDLEGSALKAPFSGIIADLQYKAHERVSPGNKFCLLIDDSTFEVEFSVMESELQDITLGKSVTISPFAMNSKEMTGTITEINPVIDENGLATVKATITDPRGLIEGMNVRVLVESEIPGRLVVPKQAVLLRDNQEVLFKYTNGMAFWTYVQTHHENSSSFAVTAHPEKSGSLEPGDTVVISGNLNLAHESPVTIKTE